MSQEEKDAATAKFKELGEALEILTDPFMKKLWDEGMLATAQPQQQLK